jgi:hypothetical protein
MFALVSLENAIARCVQIAYDRNTSTAICNLRQSLRRFPKNKIPVRVGFERTL